MEKTEPNANADAIILTDTFENVPEAADQPIQEWTPLGALTERVGMLEHIIDMMLDSESFQRYPIETAK